MSRRHQSSRRKSYGRRQHELRERHERGRDQGGVELEPDTWRSTNQADAFAFVDPRDARVHYAGE